MILSGLTLETVYFEDYLSFLMEVLELDLTELTEISMRVDLKGTWLEIKKVTCNTHQVASNVAFSLDSFEYEALVQKINFFYYRRGASRFLFLGADSHLCQLSDPDGRIWRFQNDLALNQIPVKFDLPVRNF